MNDILEKELKDRASRVKDTSHLFHLIMTFFTGGAWAIVWFLVANSNTNYNRRLWLTEEQKRSEDKFDWVVMVVDIVNGTGYHMQNQNLAAGCFHI